VLCSTSFLFCFTAGTKVASTLKSRKDSLLYAPMANVGRVTMDRDGLYIELKNINYTKKDQLYLADQQTGGLGGGRGLTAGADGYTARTAEQQQAGLTPVEILRSMQDVKVGVDQQLRTAGKNRSSSQALSLFAGGEETAHDEYDDESDGAEEEEEGSEEDSEEGSEEGSVEGDEYDNEYDDQYDSAEEEGEVQEGSDEEGSDSGDDSESGEESGSEDESEDSEDDERDVDERDVGRAVSFGQQALRGKSAGVSQEASHSRDASSSHKDQIVRGADKMASGNADLMRAVYGNNWAAGVNANEDSGKGGKGKGKGKKEEIEEESDDELFVLPGANAGVAGQQQRKSSQHAQYLLDNSVDSSRVWNSTAGAAAGLVYGEHKGSINTSSGVLNDHATLLDHLHYLDKSTGSAAGSTGGATKGAGLLSALPQEKSSAQPSESSENWWELMKSRCVTGGFSNKITASGAGGNGDDGSDGEGFGEFEDLQTGEKFGAGKRGRW
jgi:ribosome biogenesis protein BMS1